MSLMRGSQDIATFRKLADLGIPHAMEVVALENERTVRTWLDDRSLDLGPLKTEEVLRFLGGPEAVGGSLTSQQVLAFRRAVDGASIVFMHTTLDGAVTDLCRVTAFLAPQEWHPFLSEKKINVGALLSTSPSDILVTVLEEHLTALARESLPKRVDRLLAVCKPGDLKRVRPVFTYDRGELERLDRLRQAIVHAGGSQPDLKEAPAAVEYLLQVGLLLFEVVNSRFGVKIDPLRGIGLELPSNSSTS